MTGTSSEGVPLRGAECRQYNLPNENGSFEGGESMLGLLGVTTEDLSLYPVTGSPLQHQVLGSQVMYGNLQGLIQSFNSAATCEKLSALVGSSSDPATQNLCVPATTLENMSDKYEENGKKQMNNPAINWNCDIDISGYSRSNSSIYDVDSEDEYLDTVSSKPKEVQDIEDAFIPRGEDLSQGGFCSQMDGVAGNGGSGMNSDVVVVIDGNQENGVNSDVHQEQCPCLAGNPFLHVMTPLSEGQDDNTTWKKRNSSHKEQIRSDCRVPKGMGPIEIALRNAPYRKTKYIFQPVLGLTFDCENECYDFYNMYSWEVGFGIKYATRATNQKGFHTSRDFRCLCSGKEGDAKFKTKKTDCKAMIRLLRTQDDGWYISSFVEEHNHELTKSCGQKEQWYSHGKLDQCAKDMIQYLRENKVSLTKVHCIMGSIFGSMHNNPITKKSIRSICAQIAKEQMEEDVQKTLAIFRDIRAEDPGFQFSVDLDENQKIRTLLWINGKSRDQYQSFGDVISFDTTYCTNIYKMPFGLFVGVNNHFQTTIFGGVFMKEETTDSFTWVFSEFLSLMGGKLPQTVFTDQCAAMAAALAKVWVGVTHLLCKWHMLMVQMLNGEE